MLYLEIHILSLKIHIILKANMGTFPPPPSSGLALWHHQLPHPLLSLLFPWSASVALGLNFFHNDRVCSPSFLPLPTTPPELASSKPSPSIFFVVRVIFDRFGLDNRLKQDTIHIMLLLKLMAKFL